jgi:magnesium transporter
MDLSQVSLGSDFLLHVILDDLIDRKFQAVEALRDELETIEEEIINAASQFDLKKLMNIRRSLLVLRKSISHEREVLIKVCRKDSPFVGEKAIFHFRDIYDHLTKFYESIEIYREMIASHMEMYLSIMNNQMSVIANKTNASMRRLTLITTIFMPLTLLAGIGGMSEWSMMTGPENWKISYPIFLLLMILLGVLNYLWIKRVENREK